MWLPFFFQAEDGIRDRDVTGVQTCALPILIIDGAIEFLRFILPVGAAHGRVVRDRRMNLPRTHRFHQAYAEVLPGIARFLRSEERRVGKECRSRSARWQYREGKDAAERG